MSRSEPAKVEVETSHRDLEVVDVEEEKVQEEGCAHCLQDVLGVVRNRLDTFSTKHYLLSLLPVLSWLPHYKWREDLPNDLVSGFTVAVMHIPQGMAYALLAGVEPVIGIYTAFFPVLLYCLLGTMPHVSMGTFAVISILVSKPVLRLGTDTSLDSHQGEESGTLDATLDTRTLDSETEVWTRLEVAVAVTVCVGIIQLSLGLARLGSLSIVLTDCLVSGFTVGASVHVFTSQVKHILGLKLPIVLGPGRLVMTYYQIGHQLDMLNPVSLCISLVCLFVLITFDEAVGPRLRKTCRFPFPIQLCLVILFTSISRPLQLREVHQVEAIHSIGEIPLGLPRPKPPNSTLLSQVLFESIPIAIVAFSIGQGLGKLFGTKYGYKVRPNQELIAQGACNILGSFFSCIPMAGSLSRSLVQERSGCRSLVTSFTSAILLLSVLLFLGPLFEPLPVCVLASIIVAALSGMFKKISDLNLYWSKGPKEGILWTITFLSTVFLDVDIGLYIGIATSILLTVGSSCLPQVKLLKDQDVLQVRGPLNYLTVGIARLMVESHLQEGRNKGRVNGGLKSPRLKVEEVEAQVSEDELLESPLLLLDLSGLTQLDREGAELVLWLDKHLARTRGTYRELGGVMAGPTLRPLLLIHHVPVYPTCQDVRSMLESQTGNRVSRPRL